MSGLGTLSTSLISKNNTREETHKYLHTAMVSHSGTPVSFAMRTDGRIFYSVLNLSSSQTAAADTVDRNNDKNFWSKVDFTNPAVSSLNFPSEIVQVGYGIAPNFSIDKFDRDNRKIIQSLDKNGKPLDAAGRPLSDQAIRERTDPHWSSTGRFGAKAPFQVLSDSKYIYVFRQSIAAGADATYNNPPIVNNTLLVDRFILSGSTLKPSREIRYQRSRHKFVPESRKDTLAPADVAGNPFYEPTRELAFVDNLSDGGFSVLLIPGMDSEEQRWQIFSTITATRKIQSFNIRFDHSIVFDMSDSAKFVNEFITRYGLDSGMVTEVQARIAAGKTDDQAATEILGTSGYSGKGIPQDAMSEIVYTVRFGVQKDDFALCSDSEWPLMEYIDPVKKDAIKPEYLDNGVLKAAYRFNASTGRIMPTSTDFTPANGLSSCFYYQQETGPDGKPMKNRACIMLAAGIETKEGGRYIGIMNFSVSGFGRVSQLTGDRVSMPDINVQALDDTPLRQNLATYDTVNWQPPQKMYLLDIDPNGLSTSGGVLRFAYTSADVGTAQGYSDAVAATAPYLFDDSLGRVGLYFKGRNNNFFVLHFNPTGSRGVKVTDAASQEVTPPLGLQPRLDRDLRIKVAASLLAGLNTCTLTMRTAVNDGEVERWNKLPRSLEAIAAILNGNGNLPLGALEPLGIPDNATAAYLKPASGNGTLKIRTTVDNPLMFQGGNTFAGNVADGATHSVALDTLSDFLGSHPNLEIAAKSFTVTGNAVLDSDVLPKSLLSALVTEAGDVDKIWNHLVAKGFLKVDAQPDRARLKAAALSGTETSIRNLLVNAEIDGLSLDWLKTGNNADKTARRNGLKLALTQLIMDVARVRIVGFTVIDGNAQKVDYLGAGLPVTAAYQYKPNFACTPSALDGKTAPAWEHPRSFLFNANVNAQNGITGGTPITADYNYTFDVNNTIGQWEDWEASLSLEMNPAGEADGAAAYSADANRLKALQPSETGLSIEAWIKPVLPLLPSGTVVHYRYGVDNYSMGIERDSADATKFRCVAMFSGRKWVSSDSFPIAGSGVRVPDWRHLAVSHRRYWGYRLRPNEVINCGNDNSLRINGEGSFEVLVKADAAGPILEKKGEYQLSIKSDGALSFTIGGTEVLMGSPLKLSLGKFYKVTVIRSLQKPKAQATNSEYPITGADPAASGGSTSKWYDGKSNDQLIKGMAEKQDQMEKSMNLSMGGMLGGSGSLNRTSAGLEANPGHYYSVVVTGEDNVSREWTSGSPQTVSITEAYREFVMGGGTFSGTFAGVRAWRRALSMEEAKGIPVAEDKTGLLSLWRMAEGKGNYLYDEVSENHGVAGGGSWTDSPQPNLPGQFVLCLDGAPIKCGSPQELNPLPGIDNQFSIGGIRTADGFQGHFKGVLEEVRVWGVPRSIEEFTDNAFGRLKGEWELLLANYTFDKPLSPAQGTVQDSGMNNVHLAVWKPEKLKSILSTAPISTEIPQVRSALTGVVTEYNGTLYSRPGVVEYGDVQKNEDGTLKGILKRCYSFIGADQSWNRMTGYKVGNLVSQWFGQVQFDPQVMGFIEGAPPVPAENLMANLPVTNLPVEEHVIGNSVAFRQAEEVSYNYNTSKDAGWNAGVEHATSIDVGAELVIAPFGFGTSIKVQGSAIAESSWKTSGNRSQSFERGTSVNTQRSLTASLTGRPTTTVGDRLETRLGNTGYALVKSKTADIYLLRLAHNNALISISWQPNPDIPEDVNVIPFPINPLYVKQGSLDGKVSEKPDAHYPQAMGAYGQYSYFKPREAYALKNRIEREQLALKAYFEDSFDVAKTNAHFNAAASTTGVLQLLGAIPAGAFFTSAINQVLGQVATQVGYNNTNLKDDLARMGSQRNLVNTYVWTIEGGFYAESTEVAETQQETYANTTTLELGGKVGFGLKTEAVGNAFDHKSLFSSGSSFALTKTKTKSSSTSFGLDVNLSLPTSPRYSYAGVDRRTLTGGLIQPGTVDAYRFMSFYLEPQAQNFFDLFTKVIDPIWLEQSADPSAIALRQARGKSELARPCWRVMHRVTFVSRVLPQFQPEAPPSLEKSMRVSGIESNYMLIKRFEPYIANLADSGAFFTKIDEIIDGQLPELIPHKQQVKSYLALYYNIGQP